MARSDVASRTSSTAAPMRAATPTSSSGVRGGPVSERRAQPLTGPLAYIPELLAIGGLVAVVALVVSALT